MWLLHLREHRMTYSFINLRQTIMWRSCSTKFLFPVEEAATTSLTHE